MDNTQAAYEFAAVQIENAASAETTRLTMLKKIDDFITKVENHPLTTIVLWVSFTIQDVIALAFFWMEDWSRASANFCLAIILFLLADRTTRNRKDV